VRSSIEERKKSFSFWKMIYWVKEIEQKLEEILKDGAEEN